MVGVQALVVESRDILAGVRRQRGLSEPVGPVDVRVPFQAAPFTSRSSPNTSFAKKVALPSPRER